MFKYSRSQKEDKYFKKINDRDASFMKEVYGGIQVPEDYRIETKKDLFTPLHDMVVTSPKGDVLILRPNKTFIYNKRRGFVVRDREIVTDTVFKDILDKASKHPWMQIKTKEVINSDGGLPAIWSWVKRNWELAKDKKLPPKLKEALERDYNTLSQGKRSSLELSILSHLQFKSALQKAEEMATNNDEFELWYNKMMGMLRGVSKDRMRAIYEVENGDPMGVFLRAWNAGLAPKIVREGLFFNPRMIHELEEDYDNWSENHRLKELGQW